MTTIYDRKTGKASEVEAIDAKEMLRASPDLYTADAAEAPKPKAEAVDIKTPDTSPKLSDSGLPAGAEFTRRVTQADQDLLRAQRRLESEGDEKPKAEHADKHKSKA